MVNVEAVQDLGSYKGGKIAGLTEYQVTREKGRVCSQTVLTQNPNLCPTNFRLLLTTKLTGKNVAIQHKAANVSLKTSLAKTTLHKLQEQFHPQYSMRHQSSL